MRQLLLICVMAIQVGLFWGLLATSGSDDWVMYTVGGASGLLFGVLYKVTSKL